mgnify:FL=1
MDSKKSPLQTALYLLPQEQLGLEDLAPKGELQTEEPKFLLVHHTAGSTNHTIDEVPGILESIYNLHTGPEKQKNDIFYNFMIDSAGNVYETRDGSIDGPVKADATGGNQGSSQLVCLIGDFTDVMPTEAAESSLVQTLAWLAERDGIDTASGAQVTFESEGSNKWPAGSNITTPTIAGHRDMSQTACPGDSFYGYLTTAIPEKVNNYRLEQIAKQNTTTLETTTTSEVVLNDNGFADPQEGTPENSTSENNAQDLATGNTTALGITVQNQENADSSPPSESGPISGGIIVGVGVVSVVTGIGIAGGLYSSSD